MKTTCQTKKLGDICVIKPPKSEARKTLSADELVSFIPMEDLGVFTKQFSAPRERKLKDVSGSYTYFANGDVLMAKITPCFENGKIGVASGLKNGIGFGSSEYFVFRPKDEVYSDYLYYFLSTDDFREEGRKVMSGAVGHKRVPKEFIENYDIPLPSKNEQKRIVKKLDEVFEKVTKAKEAAEKNLQNSKELFESYLQSVFANPGKDWEEKKLGDVCKVIAGQSPEGKFYNKSGKGLPFYQGKKEFQEKYIGLPTTWTTLTTKEAIKDDILMSVRAPVGPINFSTQKICIGRGLAAIRAGKEVDKDFIFYAILSKEREIIGNAGAVFASISKNDIECLNFFVPSLLKQKVIVKKLDALSTETKKLEKIYEQKLADLEELKKSVLQQAFTGEL